MSATAAVAKLKQIRDDLFNSPGIHRSMSMHDARNLIQELDDIETEIYILEQQGNDNES